jgi:plasmid maintenance system antidote protein VapI
MKTIISEADAIERLKRACEDAGSQNKLAAELEVSPAFISKLLNGHETITGKVAKHLKLVAVNAYELTLIEDSPEQEQYVNRRAEYLRSVGSDPTSRKGIRGYS